MSLDPRRARNGMYFCTEIQFCTRTYIFVVEYIFSNSNVYFCTGRKKYIYICTGIYIVVLKYVFLYWNIHCCIALVGHCMSQTPVFFFK